MGQRVTGSSCRRAGPRYLGRGTGPLKVQSGRCETHCESGGTREERDGGGTRLLERVDKHGALAPLTVREALGVVAVRADDATVCPIDYLDLADAELQPLRRCAAACGAAYHAQCTTARGTRSLRRRARLLSCPVCCCAWMDALAVGAREQAGVTYTTQQRTAAAAAAAA